MSRKVHYISWSTLTADDTAHELKKSMRLQPLNNFGEAVTQRHPLISKTTTWENPSLVIDELKDKYSLCKVFFYFRSILTTRFLY